MASRFSNASSPARAGGQMNVYTGLSAIGFLAILVGVLWMIFHNMDYSKDYSRGAEPGVFTILDEGR
ncbi:MAG: hypothetical protein MK116_04795 [Phycisphaerales bacterium]|nr:hypothetical protein [Phycisphaerales bacterium]